MREKHFAALVQPFQQGSIKIIPCPVGEAHQVQRRGREEFEILGRFNPTSELLRQFHMPPDMMTQSLDAVMANHKPELESAKPAAEGHLPVAIIKDSTGFGSFVPQVLRQHT